MCHLQFTISTAQNSITTDDNELIHSLYNYKLWYYLNVS